MDNPTPTPPSWTAEALTVWVANGDDLANYFTGLGESGLGQAADMIRNHIDTGIAGKLTADVTGGFADLAGRIDAIQAEIAALAEVVTSAAQNAHAQLDPYIEATKAAPVTGDITADEVTAS